MKHNITLCYVLGALGCAHQAPLTPQPAGSPEVRQLDLGISNVFVVMGERAVVVDTGSAGSQDDLLAALHEALPDLRSISLIVLTHGHADHAGGAALLRRLSGAKIAAGAGDVPMLQAGKNRELKPQGLLARILKPFVDKPFTAFTPDLAVDAPLDLGPYGVQGKVVPAPGHTPGSLVVLLPQGQAIMGDTLAGGLLFPHWPGRHYFHDDCGAAEAHVAEFAAQGVTKMYLGHAGPVSTQDALAAVR